MNQSQQLDLVTVTPRTRSYRNYWNKKNAGFCTSCQQFPSSNGKSWCLSCLEKSKIRGINKRKALRENGMCVQTGCHSLADDSKSLCKICAEAKNNRARRLAEKVKKETFEAYGGAKCSCCGETELWVLCIDHINGGGNQHRAALRKEGKGYAGKTFYKYLKSLNFPDKDKYRVLCANCNLYAFLKGSPCYHQTKEVQI